MTPFYFGSEARRLFGIHEPAAACSAGTRAAVLCYPCGAEYLYAHRTLRRLAIKLSAAGFHTLRFDYFGTGDSAGDMTDADLAGWEADTAVAMDELRDITGAARVTLIGLRLGGTIAASVAARRTNDVDALVLWDPIISGAGYLAGVGAAAVDAEQTVTVQGFPVIPTMQRDIRSIELGPCLAAPETRSLVVVTERAPVHASLRDIPARPGGGCLAIEFMADVRPWIEHPEDMGVLPVGVIQKIAGWLE